MPSPVSDLSIDDNAENRLAVTRDYVIEIDGTPDVPPLLSIFGGKITTYRKLAEHALSRLGPWLPQDAWRLDRRRAASRREHPRHFRRFCAGSRTRLSSPSQDTRSSLRPVVRDARKRAAGFGPHLWRSWTPLRRKLLRVRGVVPSRNGVGHERCRLLDRRTKHGLHLTPAQRSAFEACIVK